MILNTAEAGPRHKSEEMSHRGLEFVARVLIITGANNNRNVCNLTQCLLSKRLTRGHDQKPQLLWSEYEGLWRDKAFLFELMLLLYYQSALCRTAFDVQKILKINSDDIFIGNYCSRVCVSMNWPKYFSKKLGLER